MVRPTLHISVGRDSAVGTVTGYGLVAVRRSNAGGEATSPALRLYRVPGHSQGVKRPERDVNHPPPSSADVTERIGLYRYAHSMPSRPVIV